MSAWPADDAMGEPLVSVVVPAFNAARYLRDSLDSVLRQTYSNMEVLVLDDASTDATPEVLRSYADCLRVHRQPTRRGQFANVWYGITRAAGEFIAVFHADDIYEATIVEREVRFLREHPQVGVVFCKDVFIDARGREYGRLCLPDTIPTGRPLSYPEVLNGLLEHRNRFLRTPGAMARASLYRALGPYRSEEFHSAADLEMWLRMARCADVAIIDEYLFRYRHTFASVAHSYHRLRQGEDNFFDVIDLYLEDGGRDIATKQALAAYEAHRAEDRLLVAANAYIVGDFSTMRRCLRELRTSALLKSPRVQRGRLLVLYAALQSLSRLPRIPFIADAFYRRWHANPLLEVA